MAVPSTNIKLSADIAAAQLGLTGPIKMTDVFVVSTAAGTVFSGSFHNISIGVPTQDFFANKIYQAYVNPGVVSVMALGNWAGYDHQHNNIITIDVMNNSNNNYMFDFYISDTPGSFQYLFLNFLVTGPGNANYTDFDTGLNAYVFNGTPGTEYYIDCSIRFMGGPDPGPMMLVNGANDSDGAGAGLARTDYTNNGPGPYTLEPAGPRFSDVLVCGGTWGASGIAWNKRTSVQMVIQ
jgi:hypothetical protein